MTRRLPPKELNVHVALEQSRLATEAMRDIFKGAPQWQPHAALAALYRFRPDLGVEFDPQMHALHMLAWPRDADYFARVCRFLKLYGVGLQWGDG